ncbi:MAG: polysaccharide pyruvyl transferase family protein [Bacteroidaceae bacterium]|nr:polysaccharide pyruvyl transferase family protein [Bacteroidaceae bacterium]
MKICTITCQNADNHGARLQCYALWRWLTDQGHDVKVIDYRPDYMRRTSHLFYFPKSIKDLVKLFVYLPQRIRDMKRHASFEAFSDKWIPRTKVYWSVEELRQNPPVADMYIAGSDQIWNTTFRNGTDSGYYLDFGGENVRRESFAASFATEELVPSSVDFVKENLKRFDKITVREQSALKILGQLGFQGELQDDPVFMLTKEQWDDVADGTGAGEKYVLVYDFYLGDDIKKKAQEIAKERGMKIYAICSAPLKYADKNFVYSSPETFISLIKNASYVVSNSFHGTAFAMIYNVPFCVLNRPDGLNVRMRDLLERHKLCN